MPGVCVGVLGMLAGRLGCEGRRAAGPSGVSCGGAAAFGGGVAKGAELLPWLLLALLLLFWEVLSASLL